MTFGSSLSGARVFANRVQPHRLALAAALVATVGLSPLANTAKPAGATSLGSAQAQAVQLESEISTEQARIDFLSQAYDAAQLKVGGLNAQVTAAEASLAQITSNVSGISARLRKQAINSWVTQGSGASNMQALLEGNAAQLMVRQQFINSIGANEQSNVDALNLAERAEHAKQVALKTAQTAAQAALASVAADRQGAISETAAYQSTLSQVHGEIATIVAQLQAQKVAAQVAAAKAAAQQLAQQQAAAQAAAQQPSASNSSPGGSAATGGAAAAGSSGSGGAAAAGSSGSGGAAAAGSSGSGASGLPTVSGGSGPPPPPGGGAATAVAVALAQVGTPYVWGGSSPGGFDCSGLVMYAWAQAGVSLPHYTVAQFDNTTEVPLSDAQPGDLVFYYTPGEPSPGHVAMYIGGGQVVSANDTGSLIQTQSIYYDGSVMGIGRVS